MSGEAIPEYELAGIETIARGVCVVGGRVLLCRAKGGSSTYLPGGHIEFGEKVLLPLIGVGFHDLAVRERQADPLHQIAVQNQGF